MEGLEELQKKIEELQKKIEEFDGEKQDFLNGWKRAKADYINYQKDEAKRLEEIIKFGNENLVKEILVLFDSFRALERQTADEQLLKGVLVIRSQLENILKKRGLENISVSLGEKFNPAFHESLAEVESDYPTDTIVEEVEGGWMLYDKVIKAAKVKVSKGKGIS